MKKMMDTLKVPVKAIQSRLEENQGTLSFRSVRKWMRRARNAELQAQQIEREKQHLAEENAELKEKLTEANEKAHQAAQQSKPNWFQRLGAGFIGSLIILFTHETIKESVVPEIETAASGLRRLISILLNHAAMLWTAIRDGLGL